MAKGYNSRGGFGGLNMNQLMKEAKKMQADLERNQSELIEKVTKSLKENIEKITLTDILKTHIINDLWLLLPV